MRKAKKNAVFMLGIAASICICICVLSGCELLQEPADATKNSLFENMDIVIVPSSGQGGNSAVVPITPTSQATVPTNAATISTVPATVPTAPVTTPNVPTAPVTTPIAPTNPTETEPTYVRPENCVHDFQIISFEDSTCEKLGKKVTYCAKCDTQITESVYTKSHTGGKATCQEPAICTLCNQPYGQPAYDDHDWKDATCELPKTCNRCGVTQGMPVEHFCADPPYDCTKGTVCDFCGTQYIAPTEHVFLEYCMINAVCIHCGTYSDTLGPIGCTYSNGKCIRCGEKDPDYVAPGGNSGGNTNNVKVSFAYTPSFAVSYGRVENATYSVSGDTLTIHITGRRNNDAYGSQSLRVKYKVYAGTYMTTLAEGSEYSSPVSAGSSFSMTITLSGVITSRYSQYYISLN